MVPTLSSMFTVYLSIPVNSFLGSTMKPSNQFLGNAAPSNLLLNTNRVGKLQLCTSRRPLIVQAGYRYYLCHFFLIIILCSPCLWLWYAKYGAKMHNRFCFCQFEVSCSIYDMFTFEFVCSRFILFWVEMGVLYYIWLEILNAIILLILCNYSDHGRPSSASIFVGGFVLGGLIVGTLGCVYAPQVWFFLIYL
jgi:hypothetical protein